MHTYSPPEDAEAFERFFASEQSALSTRGKLAADEQMSGEAARAIALRIDGLYTAATDAIKKAPVEARAQAISQLTVALRQKDRINAVLADTEKARSDRRTDKGHLVEVPRG